MSCVGEIYSLLNFVLKRALLEDGLRVSLFITCYNDTLFPETGKAVVRVLERLGHTVEFPAGQTCCGALAAHAGVRDAARELARTNLNIFLSGDFDAVITNAAGCGSTLKEYEHLFAADSPEHEQAAAFQKKMRDATEFLDHLGMTAHLANIPVRVTYQDSCHLLHGQKVREAPRNLLRAIPGVELVEMAMADYCCGSAGSYNVTETETSLELLAEKMKHARATGAPMIVTANPGCLLQMRAGAQIHSTGQEVVHVMELLDRALSKNAS